MKGIAVALIVALAIGGIFLLTDIKYDENQYIRLHIRANSNNDYDQSVKYEVKDEVVKYLTPIAGNITSRDTMYSVLDDNLDGIKRVADNKLRQLGQSYSSTVRLNKEQFPTRTYEGITLSSGIYDALIIELGEGKGDNWWCVAFPPLCFVGVENGDGVRYKSRIAELLRLCGF